MAAVKKIKKKMKQSVSLDDDGDPLSHIIIFFNLF